MQARRSISGRSAADVRGTASRDNRSLVERLRPWCLGAAAALFVARPLWPSDIATLGGAGLPVALAWLLLFTVWLTAGLRCRQLAVDWRGLDWALLALAACLATSGIWAVYHAAPRPAVNVVWEWLALLVAFWLTRQLVRTRGEARALIVVMIGLAVAEAGFGLHQYFVSLPADRAAYAADPDGSLRRSGLWYPPDSRERMLFEQRLASTEAFGTFELANSLGGFLAAWLVVAGAAGCRMLLPRRDARSTREQMAHLLAVAIAGIPISATLLLTKSRSAWLGTLVGLTGAVALLVAGRLGSRRHVGAVFGVAVLLLLSVGAFGWMADVFDAEVISEIPKSFHYRWQYWQTSAEVIADHPWLGAGPGNFRDAYTLHKVPEASEEVADPHNWFFEVAASAGIPAAIALAVVLAWAVLIGLRSWWGRTSTEIVRSGNAASHVPEFSAANHPGAVRYVLAGAAAGFVFAFMLPAFVGPLLAVPLGPLRFLVGLAVVAGVVAVWWPWIARGTIGPEVPLLGAIALLVNLLAAGGIGFPATAGTLWFLLALVLSLADRGHPRATVGRRVLVPVSLAACAVSLLCYATAYHPVVTASRAMAEGAASSENAEDWFAAAAEADPLDSQPWAQLAIGRFATWQRQPDPAHWQAFEQALTRLLELRPEHSTAWSFAGDCYRAAAEQSADPARWPAALAAYRQAVKLYPEQALRRAKLALALAQAGDRAAAVVEAEKSLALDRITPHADQKLPPEVRQAIERLVASGRS